MAKTVRSIEELLVLAHHIEHDAARRYTALAKQFAANGELAVLFAQLAEIESGHTAHVDWMGQHQHQPGIAPRDRPWPSEQSPESPAADEIRPDMTAREALTVALCHELRAVEFFESLVANATDPAIAETAALLAAEERQHVGWLEQWLGRLPPPDAT